MLTMPDTRTIASLQQLARAPSRALPGHYMAADAGATLYTQLSHDLKRGEVT